MKVYIDTSVYNRPFDDQRQPRIWLEALAFGVVLQLLETDDIQLVSSSVLEYENGQNPFSLRKRWVSRCLGMAAHRQEVDDGIRKRAQSLAQQGLKPMDALHVACAEAADSHSFLTCDDRVIRRYRGPVQALGPVQFVLSWTGEQP